MASNPVYGEGATYVHGKTGSDWVPLAVESTGASSTVVYGNDGSSNKRLRVDTDGKAKVLMHGNNGGTATEVDVDAIGRPNVVAHGVDGGAATRSLLTHTDGATVTNVRGLFGGSYLPMAVDATGALYVNSGTAPSQVATADIGPFGDPVRVGRYLQAHCGFMYPQTSGNINSDMYNVTETSAGVPADAPTVNIASTRMCEIYSGQAGSLALSTPTSSSVSAKRLGRYVPGFGVTARFSCIFDTTNLSTMQLIGMGSSEDAVLVGYPSLALGHTEFCVGRSSSVTGSAVGDFAVQSSFNVDPLDGTGPSGITLVPTNGNVFQIDFTWLGFGAIRFHVQNPTTGCFVPFHIMEYPNNATEPNLANPAGLALFAYTLHADYGITPAAGVTMRTSGMALYSDGPIPTYGPARSITQEIVSTTGSVLFALRCSTTFPVGGAYTNRHTIKVTSLSVGQGGGGNRTGAFSVYLNPTSITGATYTPYGANVSLGETSTNGTVIVGGELIQTIVSVDDHSVIHVFEELELAPGDVLAVEYVKGGTAANIRAALNWKDLF